MRRGGKNFWGHRGGEAYGGHGSEDCNDDNPESGTPSNNLYPEMKDNPPDTTEPENEYCAWDIDNDDDELK